jgi:hypothetical protein
VDKKAVQKVDVLVAGLRKLEQEHNCQSWKVKGAST